MTYLKECYGVEITRSGKDYSYLHPEKKKSVRGARLGQNYTKSEVLKRIGKQNNRQKAATDLGRRGRNRNGQPTTSGIERSNRGSEKDAFNCASYRKEKERTCTSHYITLHAIEDIVLYDLQRVLGMAKGRETEFVSMLQEKNKRMTKSDLSEKVKECEEAERRITVLDRIIQNLYEDKVSGTLSEERFIKLSKNYESEQAELTDKVKFLKEELMAVQKETADINKFMRLVKSYTEITELKPEIVRTFIDKIYVHKGEVAQGGHRQTIEIIYNCVGVIPNI